MSNSGNNKQRRLIDWLKRRSQPCPSCGGTVRPSILKWTAWCPTCRQYWRVTTTSILPTRYWFYIYEPKAGTPNRMASVPVKLDRTVNRTVHHVEHG